MLYTRPQLDLAFEDLDEVLSDEPLEDLLKDLQIEQFAFKQFCDKRIQLFELRQKPTQLTSIERDYLRDTWVEGFLALLFLKETDHLTWTWIDADCLRRLQARYQGNAIQVNGEFMAAIRTRTFNRLHELQRPKRIGESVDKNAQKEFSRLGTQVFLDGFTHASEHIFTYRK